MKSTKHPITPPSSKKMEMRGGLGLLGRARLGLALSLSLTTTTAWAAEVLSWILSLKAATATATRRSAPVVEATAALVGGAAGVVLTTVLSLVLSLSRQGTPGLGCRRLGLLRRGVRGLLLQLLLLGRLVARAEVRDGARNRLGVFVDVETLVNILGDSLDLRAKVALDVVEVEAVVPVDEVDSQSKMAIAARATDTMKIGLSILREVEIDNDVHSLNVDTTGEEVRADQVTTDAVAEVVEDPVTGLLSHLGVTVEAGVAQLGDLLRKKLDTVGGVAEDDGLVDLKLGEQCVEAVDLLLLLDKGVVLSDTPQSELIHQVDLIWVGHVLIREMLYRNRESCREEHDLTVLGVKLEQLLDDGCKLNGEELVGLVHDEHGAFAQISDLLASQVEDSARGAHYYVDGVLEANNVITQSSTAGGDHDIDAEMLSQCLAHLRGLHGEFSGRDEDQALDLGDLGIDLLQCRDDKSGRLAGSILGTRKNVLAGESDGDALLLNRRRLLETSLKNSHEQIALETKVLKLEALCVRHILHTQPVSPSYTMRPTV